MRAFWLVALTIFVPQMAVAVDEDDFNAFRREMIERNCRFDSTREGQELQKDLGWNDAKFSEVMLRLAINGEFVCPSGCRLINPACP